MTLLRTWGNVVSLPVRPLPPSPLSRARTAVRWPMPFRLEPADRSLFERASHGFDLSHDYVAPPEVVHRSFLAFVGDPPWSPGFLGVDWWTTPEELSGAVMDELYAFMTMRVVVSEHVPGVRSVAWVERWSLPLATRMVQLIEVSVVDGGKTRLRYRIAFDPPWVFRPFVWPVQRAFRWWFELSLRRLARVVESPAPSTR